MTQAQLAKSHLADSVTVEGQIEIDFGAMPEYKMIPFFKMMQREVLRFKQTHPEECAAMRKANGNG